MAQSTNTKSYIPWVLQDFILRHSGDNEFLIQINAENAKPETAAEKKRDLMIESSYFRFELLSFYILHL